MNHKCYEDDDGIQIRKAEHYPYWILEWNFEDENDPCYGTLVITFCPFCGEKLQNVQEVQSNPQDEIQNSESG